MQQKINGVEIVVRLHEQGADVLVDPGQRQFVLGEQGAHLVQRGGIDAEFGFFPGGDHLDVMPGPDAGVDANHDLAAGVDGTVKIKLREGIHADEQAVFHGVAHFVGGDVVADVEEVVRREARELVHIQLARRHGVGMAALFTHDAQKGGVRIRLGRVVHVKAGQIGQAGKVPAPLAEHVFIIHVKGRAVTGSQLARARVSKKIDLVGLDGTNV